MIKVITWGNTWKTHEECMKSLTDDLAVMRDETKDTPEATSINPNGKANYWLRNVVILAIACLLLLVAIVVKYYMNIMSFLLERGPISQKVLLRREWHFCSQSRGRATFWVKQLPGDEGQGFFLNVCVFVIPWSFVEEYQEIIKFSQFQKIS